MIYNETSYLKIVFNEEIQSAEMHWKTFTTPQELKDGLNKGLELVEEKNISNWIADVSSLGVVGEEEQKWSNENWFPRALKEGIKRMAVIVSDDIFNQMSVEEIMQNVPQMNFTSKYFSNVEEAREWIKSDD